MLDPLLPVRNDRSHAVRGLSAPRGSAPAPAAGSAPEPQAQIAAQHQAFDEQAAERAEILREHDVLEALLMAQLKNEDEITKKWIALI